MSRAVASTGTAKPTTDRFPAECESAKATTDATDAIDAADAAVMGMLHRHVPLTLLCDLTAPEGPESSQILASEGQPQTRWWEQ